MYTVIEMNALVGKDLAVEKEIVPEVLVAVLVLVAVVVGLAGEGAEVEKGGGVGVEKEEADFEAAAVIVGGVEIEKKKYLKVGVCAYMCVKLGQWYVG